MEAGGRQRCQSVPGDLLSGWGLAEGWGLQVWTEAASDLVSTS